MNAALDQPKLASANPPCYRLEDVEPAAAGAAGSAVYKNVDQLPLHRYGAGPFCRFKIDQPPDMTGVYQLRSGDRVLYVGIAADLARRYNAGYGRIHPRNCFKGGQSTNCHINRLVLDEKLAGRTIDLWFMAHPAPRQVETALIQELRPPWNRQA